MPEWSSGLATLAIVLVAIAWYLSYTAARLDRLHAKVEGAMGVLDAQLVRRAEASLELVNSGALDPASALLLADAASQALERHTEHLGDDLLDGHSFGGWEEVEEDLTEALIAALTPEAVQQVRDSEDTDDDGALARVAAAGRRVQIAHEFHHQAVREVRRMRRRWPVRTFRLAGHAVLPEAVDFDDALPQALQG